MRILLLAATVWVGASSRSHPARSGGAPPSERVGTQLPAAIGYARVQGTTLDVVFPAVAADNVGCALLNPPAERPARRRYYWLATAQYPGVRYPDNHFQQVGINVELPPEVVPTKARLDSAFRASRVRVSEGAGEPPMQVGAVIPERVRTEIDTLTVDGQRMLRVHLAMDGTEQRRSAHSWLLGLTLSTSLGANVTAVSHSSLCR
jgi:hypothetical protein